MVPEISENPTFLRYHQIWRTNPSSIVFAPLAEMLILHKCYEEAITVCKKGLEKNPSLISGMVALARAYIGVSNYKRAKEVAERILRRYPNHSEALEILKLSEKHLGKAEIVPKQVVSESDTTEDRLLPSKLDPEKDNRWYTITMAEIYASQGNIVMARKIYNGLLEKDSGNTRAREGLERLSSTEG